MSFEVWLDETLVAQLRLEGDLATLEYQPEWANDVHAFGLSPSLPLPEFHSQPVPLDDGTGASSQTLSGDAVRNFFWNLLPVGAERERLAREGGFSKDALDTFLTLLGREMPGALRVLPALGQDTVARPPRLPQRTLSRTELSHQLRDPAGQPLAALGSGCGQSLAGARDKTAVYVDGADWLLVDQWQLASTHVLKAVPPDAAGADLPLNEAFCMRLAVKVGLEVAPIRLHLLPEPVLLVTRFDRQTLEDGRVRRLPVIDGAQALGLAVGETAGLTDVFALLALSPQPMLDRRTLLRWVIFQLLIGNSGAQVRDLSFFVDQAGLRVAPAYDLTSSATSAAPQPAPWAMPIGEAATPDGVTALDWLRFATGCGLSPRSLAQELKRLCESMIANADALAQALADEIPVRVSAPIAALATARAERHRALADEVPRLDPASL